jgi:gluconate 5-dehydrogenase
MVDPAHLTIFARRAQRMQTDFSLIGNVRMVTGSARGIGFAVAKVLGRAGSDLILVDRLAQELDGAVQTIARETERKFLGVPADLARPDEEAE